MTTATTNNSNSQRGFTLIELMIVLVILAILAGVAVQNFAGADDNARVTATKSSIKVVESALNFYKLDNYRYPTTEQGLQALVQQPSGDPPAKNWKQGGYLQGGKVPKDAWQNEYQYLSPGTDGRPFDLYSLGGDSAPGGEGFDADIGTWNLDN